MIGLIETILVLVGFAALVLLCAAAISVWLDEPDEPETDDTGPYREGLDASARISSLAWEAEQAMYRAAWQRHNE